MFSMTFGALLLTAMVSCIAAFPQNAQNTEVDGFIFDGPADRPFSRPSGRTTVRPTSQSATTQSPTTPRSTTLRIRPVQISTTEEPTIDETNAQFDTCVTSCPVTPEYNPVCGTDRVSYDNPGRLRCAAVCGKTVSHDYYGPCSVAASRG